MIAADKGRLLGLILSLVLELVLIVAAFEPVREAHERTSGRQAANHAVEGKDYEQDDKEALHQAARAHLVQRIFLGDLSFPVIGTDIGWHKSAARELSVVVKAPSHAKN